MIKECNIKIEKESMTLDEISKMSPQEIVDKGFKFEIKGEADMDFIKRLAEFILKLIYGNV